jgi:hypothetical protein
MAPFLRRKRMVRDYLIGKSLQDVALCRGTLQRMHLRIRNEGFSFDVSPDFRTWSSTKKHVHARAGLKMSLVCYHLDLLQPIQSSSTIGPN